MRDFGSFFPRRARRRGWADRPLSVLAGAAVAGLCWATVPADLRPGPAEARDVHFSLCHTGGGTNCVVDGDTIWMGGVKIRIADIDTPETHPSRCDREARLGRAATLRLQQLLNAGPVALQPIGRDEDRYGRKLRRVLRDGRSLGDTLVAEGLARRYSGGRRRPWC